MKLLEEGGVSGVTGFVVQCDSVADLARFKVSLYSHDCCIVSCDSHMTALSLSRHVTWPTVELAAVLCLLQPQ